jgi:hypothetical protein
VEWLVMAVKKQSALEQAAPHFISFERFTRIDQSPVMLAVRALKNSQLTCGERHAISGTGH